MVASLDERRGVREYLSQGDWSVSIDDGATPGSIQEQQQRHKPAWVQHTLDALDALLRLPANWNSYGANPVDPRLAVAAFTLLRDAAGSREPAAPQLVPTTAGGVQLEWHIGGIDLEVEPRPAGRYYLFFEDGPHDRRQEGEFGSTLVPFAEALDELARHQ
jgi:hypothetical protein